MTKAKKTTPAALKADDPRVKAEEERLAALFADMGESAKQLTRDLVRSAAFMGVLLSDLQQDIAANGYREKYQNSATQFGYKRSVSADLFQVTVKNYSSIIRQLTDLLPEPSEVEEDEFMQFIMSNPRLHRKPPE